MVDYDIVKTGKKIKKLRTDIGLTQAQLATAVGVQQHAISQYENGIQGPSIQVLMNLAVALYTTTDYLLGL